MSATAGIIGKGSELGYADDAGTAASGPTAIAEVLSLVLPECMEKLVDAKHYGVTGNIAPKASDGWSEISPMQIKVRYLRATQVIIDALYQVTKYWRVKLANGDYWILDARLTKYGGDVIPLEGSLVETTLELTPLGNTFTRTNGS